MGSSVEWAFDPERLTELRAVAHQTGGRELLDIAKAWLRPLFIAETSLRLPLGIALVLLVLAEALFTRTGWKMPQLATLARVPRAPRVKLVKAKRAEKEEPILKAPIEEPIEPQPTTEEAVASRQRVSRGRR